MQILSVLALVLAAVTAEVYFEEDFSGDWESRWQAGTPPGKEMGKFAVTSGKWFVDEEANKGLTCTEDMRFYSITSKMPKMASSKGKPLVIQFSAKVQNHQYAYCGGGYIKLLPDKADYSKFSGDDEYNVMFGPDLCGYDVSHIHAIFNHKGKNLLKSDKVSLEYSDKNEYTHLYTFSFKPDGTYEIFFDQKSKASGKIVEDWPLPKPTIDDPEDKKPSDWVDEPEMDDPEAKKPDGYDDIPAQIPDPDATKPADWDDEDDGEWEPPLIDNPEFKGEWVAPKVANPAYKGEWKPKQIANKDYEEGVQLAAYDSTHVGFELWIVNNGTIFDNILVTDDLDYAIAQGTKLWKPTADAEKEKKEAWDKANKPAEETPAGDDDEPPPEGEDEEEKDEL
jgi:calreticulin